MFSAMHPSDRRTWWSVPSSHITSLSHRLFSLSSGWRRMRSWGGLSAISRAHQFPIIFFEYFQRSCGCIRLCNTTGRFQLRARLSPRIGKGSARRPGSTSGVLRFSRGSRHVCAWRAVSFCEGETSSVPIRNRSAEHLVIGGGLAGSTMGIRLAAAGRRVTLLERELKAHHKVCGEFLSREAVAYLEQLGVDAIALGAQTIRTVRLTARNQVVKTNLPFTALSV